MDTQSESTKTVIDKVNASLVQLMIDATHGALLEGLYESRNCKAFNEEIANLPGGTMPIGTASELYSLNLERSAHDPSLPKIELVNVDQGQQLKFSECR